MSTSGLRIAPDPQYTAEVIVMMTSLGAKPKEFYRSKQAIDLLEIKRAHYKRIDFNKDNPSGSAEVKVLSMLAEAERIECSEDGDIHLPQIFVDGCNIGGHERLQELEDDGQLSYMLWRTACPNCFSGREPEHEECEECQQEFIELMPGVQTIEEAMEFGEEAIDTDPYESQAFQAIGAGDDDEGATGSKQQDEEEEAEPAEGRTIGRLNITETSGEHDEGVEKKGQPWQGPSLADTMMGMASLEAAGEEVPQEEETEEKAEEEEETPPEEEEKEEEQEVEQVVEEESPKEASPKKEEEKKEDIDDAAYKHEVGEVREFTQPEPKKAPEPVQKEYFDDDYDEQDVGLVELDAEREERRLSIQSNRGAAEVESYDYDMVQTVKAPVKRDSSSSITSGDKEIKRRKSDESLPE